MFNLSNEVAKELQKYGKILADKNHETTEGHFIRFTTYKLGRKYFVVVMFDGSLVLVAEKENVKDLL